MKVVVASLVVTAILFFLAFGNALSLRYTPDSARSFRLRRREYLTQVLKQASLVSAQVRSAAKIAVQAVHHLGKLTKQTSHYFSKNASITQIMMEQPTQTFFRYFHSAPLSILTGPPLLPPPIV